MSGYSTPVLFPFAAFGWVGFVVALSILFRKRRGKPIFPKTPPHALFVERSCSGRSLDTPWGRIGGARNCLLVALTSERLVISPTFPFNLGFLPEIYGLDHNIDLSAIAAVTVRRGFLGQKIVVQYIDPKCTRRVELGLSRPDALLAQLHERGVPSTVA